MLNKLSQSGLSVRKFAEQEGINLSILYSWQKQFNVSGLKVSKVSSSDKWSSEEKFAAVLETSALSEVELSEYCRVMLGLIICSSSMTYWEDRSIVKEKND